MKSYPRVIEVTRSSADTTNAIGAPWDVVPLHSPTLRDAVRLNGKSAVVHALARTQDIVTHHAVNLMLVSANHSADGILVQAPLEMACEMQRLESTKADRRCIHEPPLSSICARDRNRHGLALGIQRRGGRLLGMGGDGARLRLLEHVAARHQHGHDGAHVQIVNIADVNAA